jgi:hypothetical protein
MIRIIEIKVSIRRTELMELTKIDLKLELMLITIRMKIILMMINRMIFPGTFMIIGMIVEVLMKTTMTENQRKAVECDWNLCA